MSLTWLDLFKAFVLGLIAGLTELAPVSSGGHLLLAERFLGLGASLGAALVVWMRLAALLALLSIYLVRLWRLVLGMLDDPEARGFAIGIALAFLPAALVGVLAHDAIRNALANLWIVCFALIVGGAILLWVDGLDRKPRYRDAAAFPLAMYLVIGMAQVLALIPGVGRSGAGIVAALALGADRRAAAEFSLWGAMPTLAGAIAYDIYQTQAPLRADNAVILGIGLVAAFAAAALVVRTLPDYAASRGFKLFAWWRVIVGSLGLIALAIAG
jgi:undecaprenyl-diphosphatase